MKQKAMEMEMARIEQEKQEKKVKIKRSDKEAFTKVRVVTVLNSGRNTCTLILAQSSAP